MRFEPGCADIDVAGLHAAYLRRFRQRGGQIATESRLSRAAYSGQSWTVTLESGPTITAAILVNAAGAWADAVADACGARPLGIEPKRRTMIQLRVGRSGLRGLPLVKDESNTFYFKGEGDRTIWLSPHDEVATDPCDAAPDEEHVAVAIDRFERVVDWPVEGVERRWAGRGPSPPIVCQSTALTSAPKACSGARDREDSASRPHPPQPSSRPRHCWATSRWNH